MGTWQTVQSKIKTLNVPFDGKLENVAAETLPFTEAFNGDSGTFSIEDKVGTGIWTPGSASGQTFMKGTSYIGGANTEGESWLISPEIDATTAENGVKLSFKQCINKYFGTVAEEATLWAREKDGEWTQFTISYPTLSGTWSSFEEQVVDLSAFKGKTFQFAFKYVGHSAKSGTWEVNNVSVTDEAVAAYTFLAELEGPAEVAANITSVTIKVTGNVAWTAEPSEGVTLDKTSGEGNATITASFAANTATTPKNYSVMVRTDNTVVDNDEWEITFSQAAASVEAKSYPFEETFATGQGDFTIDNKTLDEGLSFVWKHDTSNKYMKASAYVGGSNKKSESWLISPLVDLTGATEPTLYFSQCISKFFGDVTKEATVWIKKEGGEWAQLAISYPEITSGNWSPMTDFTVDIKSYAGKKVQVAFKYTSSTEAAGTWEVKNFRLAEAVNGPVDPTFTVPSSLTVEEGKTAKINVTTNTDGAITYTSASTAVATVAADGTVTGVAAGTTTVTVAAAATDTYNAASATVSVTVTAAQTGTHYGRVNTITSGKKYLIAGGNQQKVLGTISNNKAAGVDVEITDGKIVSNETTDALAVTITAADGKYSIVLANGKYLVYTGSSTNLTAASSASDTWTVGEGAQGMFRFTSTKTEGRALSFRASTYNVFGAYSANNINGTEYFDIDLYELGAEPVAPNQPSEITTSISMPGNQTVYIGESFELNATSNVEAATITYESEDPTIATVSASGTVTGVAEGSVKVYARIAGVEGKYTSAERYCNVTVSKKPDVVGGTWEATSLSAIADGAEFILVSTKEDASYAMSNENGTASAPAAVSVTISSNTISNPSSNIIFVMKKAENGYIFQLPGDEGKWVYTTTSNNGIRVGTGDKNLFNLDSESGYLIINDAFHAASVGVFR